MKLSCPQCGADIVLQPRSLQLICPFCSTPLKFSTETHLERYKMEPTVEEEPAAAIARDALGKQDCAGSIVSQEMEYLPFYRFLVEKKDRFTEHVYSAFPDPPFPLFSIPSGKLTALEKTETVNGPEPRKQLPEILRKAKLEDAKSIEEMLLLYLPFWKISLSTGEVIWIDAVQGRVAGLPTRRSVRHGPRLYRKFIFSSAVIALFVIGVLISPFMIRLLFQMAGAGLLFFLFRKEMKDAS